MQRGRQKRNHLGIIENIKKKEFAKRFRQRVETSKYDNLTEKFDLVGSVLTKETSYINSDSW